MTDAPIDSTTTPAAEDVAASELPTTPEQTLGTDDAPAQDSPEAGVSRVEYAKRRQERAQSRSARVRMRLSLSIPLALLALAVMVVLADLAFSVGRIHPGVSVGGVSVGGLSTQAAAAKLNTDLPGRFDSALTVTHGEQHWEIEPGSLGLTFDGRASARDAFRVGRGGFLTAVASRMHAVFGGVKVAPVAALDPTALNSSLGTIAKSTDVAYVDSAVNLRDRRFTTTEGKDGLALDREAAADGMLETILNGRTTYEVPVAVSPMAVSKSEADSARDIAERMARSQAHITFQGKSWTFSPTDVAAWVSFRRSDATTSSESASSVPDSSSAEVTLIAYIDPAKVTPSLETSLGTQVGRPAKNAEFKTSSGSVIIVPSQDGIGPDVETLCGELTVALAQEEGSRTVELRTTRTVPTLTTEQARAMGISDRMSRFTTTYSSGNRPRVNNIHLLGDSLDGTLIAPGKTFSFNDTIGERTAEKGYQEAGAIVNGKLVPQLGGGICQVGTTLFNTVFDSGLPVVERHNHSQYISHYPKGRDATVSWGGPNLRFKNDTQHWVLISVSYSSTSITIALYGTDPGYEVESQTGEWTNVRAFSTKEIKDPTMEIGSKIIEEKGQTGRSITVVRVVTKDGAEVRRDTFRSVYRPVTQVVRIGTKPISGSVTSSVTVP